VELCGSLISFLPSPPPLTTSNKPRRFLQNPTLPVAMNNSEVNRLCNYYDNANE
jgi:hypothetical protein